MADIKPFPAIRPQAVKAAEIAALPYDVFTREEAVKEIEKHPLSFLRVDRPETNFPEGTDMYSPKVYERRESFFGSWWIPEICVRIWSPVIISMSSVWGTMCRPVWLPVHLWMTIWDM